VRVMLHAYMPVDAGVSHSYLRDAVRLRDDLVDDAGSGHSDHL